MTFAIRSFHPSDLSSLYRICALTADSGKDASPLHKDPEVLGHFFAGAYAVLEPDLCFILTDSGTPCGYVLGTRDSELFASRCEESWFPVLRTRYPAPDPEDHSAHADIIRCIHRGCRPNPEVAAYPAHLHIDLLPQAQGHGHGRKLIEKFLGRLIECKVPGVHLGVGGKNERAIAFYKHMGFNVVSEQPWGLLMGMELR